MRLLLDHNVSPRLCAMLADLFPDSIHVREVALQTADDATIWDFAAHREFAVLTKDADFRQRSLLFGYPPKIV